MNEIYVKDIIREAEGNLIIGNPNDKCTNFSIDTRDLQEGDVFVGIKGEKFDGNTLYLQALEKGAKTCILQGIEPSKEELQKYKNKNIIIVENTRIAIGKIAKYKRSLYNIPVVAITGSVGKTSTKDIIASVISQKYDVVKTQGNFNNDLGLPLTILRLKDHNALVVEMGMNHLGEIEYLTNIARPTIAVITNVGTAHIGLLGSRENILKAKLEILTGLKKGGPIIINNDNDLLNMWNKTDTIYNKITYGIEEKSDIIAKNIQISENFSTFLVELDGKEHYIKVPISGKHFVYNSLSAIAVGRILGIEINLIQKGIEGFELTKKRMDLQKIDNNITVINDSYNASYDSLKAALEYLKEIKGNKKIAVLGDMKELGDYTEEMHRLVGKEVVQNQVDILITVGESAKYIADEAKKNMDKEQIYTCDTKIQAYNILKQKIKEEDVILIKAANSLNLSEILEMLKK